MNTVEASDAPEHLGDSEARYRAVIDALTEGIVLQDRDGTIVASNASAERILRMTADELHGRTSLDPGWRAIKESGEPFPGHEHPAMVTLRTGKPQSNVIMGVRRGSERPTWISINSQPLLDAATGEPRAVVCSFFDITESKNLEAQLRESEQKYRSLFEHSMDGVLLTRPDGAILAANAAACRMLGWSEGEIIEGGRGRIVDLGDPRLAPALQERARTGRVSAELTLVRKDGSKFPVELTSVIFVDGHGEQRSSMLFRDISERLHLDRMKSEFVSTVSHELRTPLTSIRGVLGLLGGGVLGELSQVAIESVRMAIANAERLARLLDDILDLAKVEGGHFVLRRVAVDPAKLLESALEVGSGLAAPADIELRTTCLVQGSLLVDPERVVQVLANLLSNAVKFSERGTVVELIARPGRAGRIRFEVTDRGKGIAHQDVPQLFTRFYQVDSSDTRKRGGSGLGLAISKAIVVAHGGDIGVETTPGAGSTFWFELPLGASGGA